MSPNTLAWLNRIGILLNFLGGFMIAPELIGEARISRFEQRLKYLLGRWWLSLWLRIETEGDDMDILDGRDDFKWIVGFICMVASIYAVEPLLENPPWRWEAVGTLIELAVVLGLLLVMYTSTAAGFLLVNLLRGLGAGAALKDSFRSSGRLLLLPIRALVWVFLWLPYLMVMVWALVLGQGDNMLRSVMVSGGIMFLILGNLLQFIATF